MLFQSNHRDHIKLHYTTLTMISYICNMFNGRNEDSCYSITIVVFMTIPWWGVSLHEKQFLIALGTRSDPFITSSVSIPWGEDEEVVLSSIELMLLDQVRSKCLLLMLIDDGFSVLVDRFSRFIVPSAAAERVVMRKGTSFVADEEWRTDSRWQTDSRWWCFKLKEDARTTTTVPVLGPLLREDSIRFHCSWKKGCERVEREWMIHSC